MKDKTRLEEVIFHYIDEYAARNHAAAIVRDALQDIGIGLYPVIDHVTIRTKDIDARAEEFLSLGYAYSETLHYDDWWAKVYRAQGCPALFIDQAYEDDRGKTSIIPGWVDRFGDRTLHHIAILVADIETSIRQLSAKGIQFSPKIVGERGQDLRQIFSVPEQVDGSPFSVLELTERHHGYQGFSPPQANSLMQSTVR